MPFQGKSHLPISALVISRSSVGPKVDVYCTAVTRVAPFSVPQAVGINYGCLASWDRAHVEWPAGGIKAAMIVVIGRDGRHTTGADTGFREGGVRVTVKY